MKEKLKKVKYRDAFLLFMVGCVLGVLLEGTFCYIRHGAWETHVTFLWGPFNIVYGLGVVAMYLASVCLDGKSVITNFLWFVFLGSAIEWLMGFIQDKMFNSYSWTYGIMPIGKYLCVPFMLAWGILGVLFMKTVMPVLNKCFEYTNSRILQYGTVILTVFMCVNLALSVVTFTRWGIRAKSHQPKTKIGEFIDKVYPDDYLQSRFVEWKMNGT